MLIYLCNGRKWRGARGIDEEDPLAANCFLVYYICRLNFRELLSPVSWNLIIFSTFALLNFVCRDRREELEMMMLSLGSRKRSPWRWINNYFNLICWCLIWVVIMSFFSNWNFSSVDISWWLFEDEKGRWLWPKTKMMLFMALASR